MIKFGLICVAFGAVYEIFFIRKWHLKCCPRHKSVRQSNKELAR